LRVLLATEVYPPRTGGAGWSTRALALGLREAGHDVHVATTAPGPDEMDGIEIHRLPFRGRRRLGIPRSFARYCTRFDHAVIHAQHSLSALGCLARDRADRVAVTIRDHWPVCFWSTRMSRGAPCPKCGLLPMSRCIQGHVPPGFGVGFIPYMREDLRQKARALSRAGAVLPVSRAIADELQGLGLGNVEVIPNIVDPEESRSLSERAPSFALPGRFMLFVGKLEENKGVRFLLPAVAEAKTALPLVVLGEGPLAGVLQADAASLGVSLLLRGWAAREDVLATLARAHLLVFPSLWEEPLSRVLLESLALGTPVVGLATGGTREIFPEGSGLLVSAPAELGDTLARLARDERLRAEISEAARARALAYSPEALVPRYERVYRRLQ